MNIKSKKFTALLLTLVFAVGVFAVTAFAGEITPTPENSAPAASASETLSSEPASSEPASEVSSDASNPSSVESKVSSAVSSHTPASSKKETASSKHVPPVTSHDTQANQVEKTASQAAAAVSDPDVLSSENWGALLSSGEPTQSQTQTAGTSAISSTSSTAAGVGGVSWILILGVILIVLAICGVSLFVYLQFFSDNNSGPKGRGGQGTPKGNPVNTPAKNSPPLTFTDISSDSDGTQHREDYVPNGSKSAKSLPVTNVKSAALKPQVAKKAPVTDMDATAPIPKAILPNRKPVVPTQGVQSSSKSQATPVTNGSDFDWEKFFNEQK